MKKLAVIIVMIFLVTACEKPKGIGRVVFYATTYNYGAITVTIDHTVFVAPVTTNPDFICQQGGTGYVQLYTGNYTFTAVSSKGQKWNGSVEIPESSVGNCVFVTLN